jgi:hypothetical protein
MSMSYKHEDQDAMGLAKDHKLQQEIEREEQLRERAIAAGFTDLYGDDGMGMGLRGTINGRVEWVKDYFKKNRDSAINRAMAEVAGWNNIHVFNKWKEGGTRNHRDGDIVGDFKGLTRLHIPNYLTDLNAVHEVENSLSDKHHCILYAKLMDQYLYPTEHRFISATARQRCTAILKTLNRWNPEWDL